MPSRHREQAAWEARRCQSTEPSSRASGQPHGLEGEVCHSVSGPPPTHEAQGGQKSYLAHTVFTFNKVLTDIQQSVHFMSQNP